MKKIVLLFLLLAIGTIAFSQEITVRFTGQLNGTSYCRLDSVKVTNLTRNWTETVEYPDTIIVLGGTVGTDLNIAATQGLGQNIPNPFDCETRVELSVSQREDVRMQLLDVAGKVYAEYNGSLDAGVHTFDISAANPQTYLLNAMVGNRQYSIRMVNVGSGCGSSIKYAGISGSITAKLTSANEFQNGDNMRYVGYSTFEGDAEASAAIEHTQTGSEDLTLNFTHCFTTYRTDTQSACDSYTWIDGITYTESTTEPTFTLINAAGCDSIVTLHLTINHSNTGIDEQIACDSFEWIDGITYTESTNEPTYTLTNAEGCDSVVTLHLTINNMGIDTQISCDSFTWIDGITYTESTTEPTFTLTNSFGCDSVVTLHLTINHSNTGIDEQTACGSFEWIDGITYTESTDEPTFTLTNATGCDSVVTLHLTINHSSIGIDEQTACDSYTWINGVTYTESIDEPTFTLTNAAGCDSVVTLHLTIKRSSISIDEHTTCESYEWIDGITYTESTTEPTYTLTNAAGCDSVVTLHLTIICTPTVQTNDATNITFTGATLNGNVVSDGNATITDRGFMYGTSADELTETLQSGSGTGSYTANLSELTSGTTYYYKSYATNSEGTAYGNVMSFTTQVPDYSDPTGYTNGYGYVDLGLPSGTKWATCNVGASTPTDYGNYYAWGETEPKEIYNWWTYIYFNNGTITKYTGSDGLTTLEAMDDAATANLGSGWCMPTKEDFEELQSNCTVTWTTQNGVNGRLFTGPNGNSIFLPAAGYRIGSSFYNAGSNGDFWSSSLYTDYPDNAWGLYFGSGNCGMYNDYRCYGQSVRAVRPDRMPSVTTDWATSITTAGATLHGNVTAEGSDPVTERGFIYGTSENELTDTLQTGSGTGSYTANLSELASGTTYYYRAYATNSVGTAYGNRRWFTTECNCGRLTIRDYDGNIYSTVQIGEQCWMAENLRTTTFADGTSIPLGSDTSSVRAYRYYPNNNGNNVSLYGYGYLYNWSAVMHGASSSSTNPSNVQGICPNGWHLPSDAEWTQLTNYLMSQSEYRCGGYPNIAKPLASKLYWNSSTTTCAVGNTPADNNATGFNAKPAGYYGYDGSGSNTFYLNFGLGAYFWSATSSHRYLWYNYSSVRGGNTNHSTGKSVRCVKD